MLPADILPRIGLAALSIALTWYQVGIATTVDSDRFLKSPRPEPFHARWLAPFICRNRLWAWTMLAWGSLLVSTLYFPGGIWAAALWVCTPWFRTMAQIPVLVDAPALAVSLAPPSVLLGFIGGSISEKVPVWVAIYSWSWGLPTAAGIIAVLAAYKWCKSVPREGPSAFAVARARGLRWSDLAKLILPWGAGVAALFTLDWSAQELVTVVVAYGQMLMAHDGLRMYMWSAPTVLPKAISVIPASWRPIAVVLTWFNPFGTLKQQGEALV